MSAICILLLMVLCHIIDDFVLQPVCLSNLKQKSWWEKNVLSESKSYRELYQNDYKIALLIHALSWSIMIHLPIMFLWTNVPGLIILMTVGINCFLHAFIDDKKANEKVINLKDDQCAHLLQIVVTFVILFAFNHY